MDQKIQQQIVQLVQAAMQGDQQANQQIQQIQQAAQQGNQQAVQIFQLIQEVAKQLGGQKQSMKQGAKITYLKHLKMICNPDEELTYMKAGGKVCPVCQKKKGGVAPKKKGAVEDFKEAYFKKCGGKMKKKKEGGEMPVPQDKNKIQQKQQTPTKKQTSTKKQTPLPTKYKFKEHKDLIDRYKKSGRNLPKASMDSLQWYNRHDPNDVGV